MEFLPKNFNHIILDNVLPSRFENHLENKFLSPDFPWFTNLNICQREDYQEIHEHFLTDENLLDSPGIVHDFLSDGKLKSPDAELLLTLLSFIEEKMNFNIESILRIRARTTFQYPGSTENSYCGPHVDMDMRNQYYSLIYYVNDSDGDTVLFDKIRTFGDNQNNNPPKVMYRIKPKKGRFLLFDGNIYHSGNCPINYKVRTIINYDFTIN